MLETMTSGANGQGLAQANRDDLRGDQAIVANQTRILAKR